MRGRRWEEEQGVWRSSRKWAREAVDGRRSLEEQQEVGHEKQGMGSRSRHWLEGAKSLEEQQEVGKRIRKWGGGVAGSGHEKQDMRRRSRHWVDGAGSLEEEQAVGKGARAGQKGEGAKQ